jgi:hypothetical protein
MFTCRHESPNECVAQLDVSTDTDPGVVVWAVADTNADPSYEHDPYQKIHTCVPRKSMHRRIVCGQYVRVSWVSGRLAILAVRSHAG